MVKTHAAFLTSTIRTFSQRQNAISDTKKTIDGSSRTPSVMCWKCAKNDIERTASMTKPGAHGRTVAMTRSNPAMTNRKLTAVAPMKASTWLLVRADTAAASARNAPAISHEPTYDDRITPLSGEPSTFTVIHSGMVSTSASAAKAQAASHLPSTICQGATGSVIN